MQSSAHLLLLCSAVGTMGWVLIGVICPVWEPKSCTKGYLRNFPLSGWDLTLQHFYPLSLTVLFTYILGLLRAWVPYSFLCYSSGPFLQPLWLSLALSRPSRIAAML